jgi:L-threonylcarbamoyladenylate synthase
MIWVRPSDIEEVANALKKGEIAIVPTETVYGVAATLSDEALAKVFQAKGRSENKPLIVGVADSAMAKKLVLAWPQQAEELVNRFWPGPLTLVLPKTAGIPDLVTAGGETVAVRAPGHHITLRLIEMVGAPLVLTSANRSGGSLPRSATEAVAQIGMEVAYVLDDGPTPVGIESTVYEVAAKKMLRQGAVSIEDIEAALGLNT